MPVGTSIPYTWYETPNIHHTTLLDFRDFVRDNGGVIDCENYMRERGGNLTEINFMPNMRADTIITVAHSAE